MRLPGAPLDGGAAAAFHIDVVRPAVLRAEGGDAVGRAAVGGLHVAALRVAAAAIHHVELAGQPVRCAEARPSLLGVAERGDGAAAGPLAAAVDKVHIGGALVAVAEEERALRRIAKGRSHTAAAGEGAHFAEQVHFRLLPVLLAVDGASPVSAHGPEVRISPTFLALEFQSLGCVQLNRTMKA